MISGRTCRPRSFVELLAKQAAELALRLAALPAAGLRTDPQTLDAVEQLAQKVLREVSAIRANASRTVGESSGTWRVVQIPGRR